MISVNYKYKKILFYLITSLLSSLIMIWVFVNVENLVLEKVTSGRYSYVGKFFYKREKLLIAISLILILLFVGYSIYLIRLLISGKAVFKVESNILYKNDRKIIHLQNIRKVEFQAIGNNSFILICICDYEKFLNDLNLLNR